MSLPAVFHQLDKKLDYLLSDLLSGLMHRNASRNRSTIPLMSILAVAMLMHWFHLTMVQKRRRAFPIEWAVYLCFTYSHFNDNALAHLLPHVVYPGMTLILLDRLLYKPDEVYLPFNLPWWLAVCIIMRLEPRTELELVPFSLLLAGIAIAGAVYYRITTSTPDYGSKAYPFRFSSYIPPEQLKRMRERAAREERRWRLPMFAVIWLVDIFYAFYFASPYRPTLEVVVAAVCGHGYALRWAIGTELLFSRRRMALDELHWEPADYALAETQLKEQYAILAKLLERLRTTASSPQIDAGIRREASVSIDRHLARLDGLIQWHPSANDDNPFGLHLHFYTATIMECTATLELWLAEAGARDTAARDTAGLLGMGPVQQALDTCLNKPLPLDGISSATSFAEQYTRMTNMKMLFEVEGPHADVIAAAAVLHHIHHRATHAPDGRRLRASDIRAGFLPFKLAVISGYVGMLTGSVWRLMDRWENAPQLQEAAVELLELIVRCAELRFDSHVGRELKLFAVISGSVITRLDHIDEPSASPLSAPVAGAMLRLLSTLCACGQLPPDEALRALRATARVLKVADASHVGRPVAVGGARLLDAVVNYRRTGDAKKDDEMKRQIRQGEMRRLVVTQIVPGILAVPLTSLPERELYEGLMAWYDKGRAIKMEAAGFLRWQMKLLHAYAWQDEGTGREAGLEREMLGRLSTDLHREGWRQNYIKDGVSFFTTCLRKCKTRQQADTTLDLFTRYVSCESIALERRLEAQAIVNALVRRQAIGGILDMIRRAQLPLYAYETDAYNIIRWAFDDQACVDPPRRTGREEVDPPYDDE